MDGKKPTDDADAPPNYHNVAELSDLSDPSDPDEPDGDDACAVVKLGGKVGGGKNWKKKWEVRNW